MRSLTTDKIARAVGSCRLDPWLISLDSMRATASKFTQLKRRRPRSRIARLFPILRCRMALWRASTATCGTSASTSTCSRTSARRERIDYNTNRQHTSLNGSHQLSSQHAPIRGITVQLPPSGLADPTWIRLFSLVWKTDEGSLTTKQAASAYNGCCLQSV